MSTLHAASYGKPQVLNASRNEAIGFLLSALVPLGLGALALGALHGSGAEDSSAVYGSSVWLPVFYLMLFPMWGAAGWFCRRTGAAGLSASNWTSALVAWGLSYPFATAMLDPFFLTLVNLASLVLITAAAIRVAAVSRIALTLIMPSIFWLALAALPGYVLLTGGWSPGFAITIKPLGADYH